MVLPPFRFKGHVPDGVDARAVKGHVENFGLPRDQWKTLRPWWRFVCAPTPTSNTSYHFVILVMLIIVTTRHRELSLIVAIFVHRELSLISAIRAL